MKILIAGDYCPIGRNRNLLKKKEYSRLFGDYKSIISTTDYSIVNFECPLTLSDKSIEKTGPCIKTEDINSLKALKYLGFDALTLANNHIQDYGEQGVIDTISFAKREGFDIVGAGKNDQDAKVKLIRSIQGVKVGFVNIAENEFCSAEENFAGANTFSFIQTTREIRELKLKVDKVIVIYHGGREHYQLPTPDLRDRFRYFADIGADAVVGHHTHCYSGFEYYQDKPLIYSLGNFLFDYKKKYQKGIWTEGMSAILSLSGVDDNFELKLIPHYQGREKDSTLNLMVDSEKDKFEERIHKLNEIIDNDELFYKKWQEYLISQEKFYLSSLYVRNLYVRALFMKGLLPIKWLRGKHNRLTLNLIRCEAHHEITKGVLNKRTI